MGDHINYIMTLANSIIGVGVLAMPFCFQKCGIILAIIMILLSSIISRLSCHFLLKASIYSRRKNFEFLAFHALGSTGKLLVELGIIGFLMGTVIAFFVVVGDLGPEIIAKALNIESSQSLRSWLLIFITIGCVIPLGLLRNVDSLASICTITIGFYICLVLKVMLESTKHISDSDWIDKVELWNPSGILQCLPIFSMALFCQTQIFEIYSNMENASLEKMNLVVKWAINMCSLVYILVGSFGYIAFCHQHFGGNILLSFSPTPMSDIIKMGFVLSVAFSFPLVIFPCRSSLYSLLFRRVTSQHEVIPIVMPERRFRCLTIFIIAVGLAVAMAIPSIELVLGLVGSTMGVAVCVLLPAACYVKIVTKQNNERLLAQIVLVIGVLIMIFGTYANLYAMDEANSMVDSSIVKNEILIVPLDDEKVNVVEKSIDKISDVVVNSNEKVEKMIIPKKDLPKEHMIESPPLPVEKDELVQVINLVKDDPAIKQDIGKSLDDKSKQLEDSLKNKEKEPKKLDNKIPQEISDDAIKKEDHEIGLEKNNLQDSAKNTDFNVESDLKISKDNQALENLNKEKTKVELVTEAIVIEKIKKEKQQLDDEFQRKVVQNSNLLANMNIKKEEPAVEKSEIKLKSDDLKSEPEKNKINVNEEIKNKVKIIEKAAVNAENEVKTKSKEITNDLDITKAVPIASHIKNNEKQKNSVPKLDEKVVKVNLTKNNQELPIPPLNNHTIQKNIAKEEKDKFIQREILQLDTTNERFKRDAYQEEKHENCEKNDKNVMNEMDSKILDDINILNPNNALKDSIFLDVLKPSVRDLKSIESKVSENK